MKTYHTNTPEWEQVLRALHAGEDVNEAQYQRLNEDEKTLITALTQKGQLAKAVKHLDKMDLQKDWLSVKSRIAVLPEKEHHRSLYRTWIRYAAAILLPLLVIGLYFNTKDKIATVPIIESADNGFKKATLILSDNSRIALGATGKSMNITDGTQALTNEKDAVIYNKGSESNTMPVFNTLIVPKGGEYKLVLADGTEIWVNADTRIRYQTNIAATAIREVFLEKGEAFFKVARNPDKPFIVYRDQLKIKVLGTSFNVNTYAEIIQTTLVEGKVNVSLIKGKETLDLTPQQQAVFDPFTGSLTKRDVDPYSFIAWKDGILAFENETMDNLMAQIGRLYDYEIQFKDERLKQLHYSGSTEKSTNVQGILNIIQKTTNLKFTLKERTIIVEKSTRR